MRACASLKYDPRKLDVSDASETINALADTQRVIAVLNAGKALPISQVLLVNFVGVVNTAATLLPTTKKDIKIVVVENMLRLLPFGRAKSVRRSKVAVHYFAKSLKIYLYNKGKEVQTVSPGFLDTPLAVKNSFTIPMQISAEEAAKEIRYGIIKISRMCFFPLF